MKPGGPPAVNGKRVESIVYSNVYKLSASFSTTTFIRNSLRYVKYLAGYAHDACKHARTFTYKVAVILSAFFFIRNGMGLHALVTPRNITVSLKTVQRFSGC